MPFNVERARRALITFATVAGGALLTTGSAQATPVLSALTPCPEQVMVTPFQAFGDYGSYTLPPGGGFEPGTMPWITSGGAEVVSGNEPYYVSGDTSEAHSLSLPAGSSATSAPLCVSLVYPYLRFFAQNTGSSSGTLRVEVETVGPIGGLLHWTQIGSISGSASWSLTAPVPLLLNALSVLSLSGQTPVAFRFTPEGAGSSWRIDDVYVDPYRRG